MPGDTALTLTPCAASSSTAPAWNEFSAPLLMAYRSGRPITALPDEMFTTDPPSCESSLIVFDIRESASLVQSIGPTTLTAKIAFRSSTLACSMDLHLFGPFSTPALLTSPATRPSICDAHVSMESNMATTSFSTETSAGKAAASPPASTMDFTTASAAALDPVLWLTATAQPSLARRRQHAAPIPLAPPVTTAIFFEDSVVDDAATCGLSAAILRDGALDRSERAGRYKPRGAAMCVRAATEADIFAIVAFLSV